MKPAPEEVNEERNHVGNTNVEAKHLSHTAMDGKVRKRCSAVVFDCDVRPIISLTVQSPVMSGNSSKSVTNSHEPAYAKSETNARMPSNSHPSASTSTTVTNDAVST